MPELSEHDLEELRSRVRETLLRAGHLEVRRLPRLFGEGKRTIRGGFLTKYHDWEPAVLVEWRPAHNEPRDPQERLRRHRAYASVLPAGYRVEEREGEIWVWGA